MSLFTSTDTSLPAVLPYRSILPDGCLDLRGNGVTVAYEFIGPSPEVSDLADLASRSRQLAGALVHLGTGDMVQITFNREPAPVPPERVFIHRAATLVDAERRAQFAAENHWLTPTRLFLTHAFDPPVRSWVRSMLFATNGPQRQTRNDLLREYALNRFAAFEDAAAGAVGLRRLSEVETFRDLLMNVVCSRSTSDLWRGPSAPPPACPRCRPRGACWRSPSQLRFWITG